MNTGFATCDCCGNTYDYAPDSPAHICISDRDLHLISGRIDGLRNALEIMADSANAKDTKRRIELRISELMKLA